MFGGQAKWTVEVDDASRIVEFVSRAFHTACSGRPGPVVLSLPKDMLRGIRIPNPAPRFKAVETWPGSDDLCQLTTLIEHAERPIFIVGGTRWDEVASHALKDFAQAFDMPIATSYRRAPVRCLAPLLCWRSRPERNPKLVQRVKKLRSRRCRWRPAGRDSLAGLSVVRHSVTADEIRAYLRAR